MSEITLRMATPDDAPQLQAIYAPYVENTAISFEYEPPTVEEFRSRMVEFLAGFPYLCAVRGQEILGYAYAHPYGVRKAYSWSVELSVYIRRDCRGLGLGRRLYEAMETILRAQNVTNLYALVAGTEEEDEYLTHDSVRFHTAMGYTKVGHMHKAGYKFGRWYDMLTFEKLIADHPAGTQKAVVPWYAVEQAVLEEAGVTRTLRLVYPEPAHARQVMDYKAAFVEVGDSMDGTGGLDSAAGYDAWLSDWHRKRSPDTVPEGLVDATTYLALDECGNLVGMIDLRHRLNDYLLAYGGHIGYSVAPTYRGHGFARQMLEQVLQVCKTRGLERVLVTCDEGNPASERTILHCGGVLENKIEDGRDLVCRYWIEVK